MAKRRIILSSQEMNEITKRIQTLEAQLGRSNARVEELETGVTALKATVEAMDDLPEKNSEDLLKDITAIINPPVRAREMPNLELEAAS